MLNVQHILQTLDRSESNKHPVPRYSFLNLMPVGDYDDTDGVFDIQRCYEHHIEVWMVHNDWNGHSLVVLDGTPVCVALKDFGYYRHFLWFSRAERLRMLEFTLESSYPMNGNREIIWTPDQELPSFDQQADQPKYKRYFKEQA